MLDLPRRAVENLKSELKHFIPTKLKSGDTKMLQFGTFSRGDSSTLLVVVLIVQWLVSLELNYLSNILFYFSSYFH